jgi:hypothetical protein
MPLQITPHSIAVSAVIQTVGSDSVLENPAAGSPGSAISCLCVPLEPSESFRRFGVVLVDAWTVYLNVPDAATLAPQDEVLFNSQKYYVKGDVEIHQNGDPADCAIAHIVRLQYPEGS